MAKTGLIIVGVCAVLAACAASPPKSSPKATPIASNDTCGAQPLKYLISRPKTEIPVAVDPKKWRVTCTTCPVTMDFSPTRLNIFFDAETGIVKEVKCG